METSEIRLSQQEAFLINTSLPKVALFSRRFESQAEKLVAKESDLHLDDDLCGLLPISHRIITYLGISTNNLMLLAQNLFGTLDGTVTKITTHPHAYFPLFRASLENSCKSCFLVGPGDRSNRLTNLYMDLKENLRNEDYAMRIIERIKSENPKSFPNIQAKTKIRLETESWLAQKKIDLGISNTYERQNFTPSRIVKEAAKYTSYSADFLELIWRLLSSGSHGDTWSNYLINEVRLVDEKDTSKFVGATITASHSSLILMFATCTKILEEAWELFETRRSKPN